MISPSRLPMPVTTNATISEASRSIWASSIMCSRSLTRISGEPFRMRSGTWKYRRCVPRRFRCSCCPSRVRAEGLKVVLTGEGADEIFAGYDIFKEAKVRAFWAREPHSRCRPLLLNRLHPEVFADVPLGQSYLTAFFGQDLTDVGAPDYSHAIRWRNTRRTWRFLSDDVTNGTGLRHAPPLPVGCRRVSPVGA